MPLSDEEKRERNRIRCRKYYEKNKQKSLEQRKEYYEKNKEKCKAKVKEYRDKNKEKIAIKKKEYCEKNKEKCKEYLQRPNSKKIRTIADWKSRGLICEDYDSLYCHYSLATECDNCGVEFGERGDGSGTFKCMDHSHTTGKFRNFLCNKCNLLRGE